MKYIKLLFFFSLLHNFVYAIKPVVLVHGGLKNKNSMKITPLNLVLNNIANKVYEILLDKGPYEALIKGIILLEDNPSFNAGTGSKLQQDCVARMTAFIMSGKNAFFSGVINIENVKNPILVAESLFGTKHPLLTGTPLQKFARDNGFAFYNPLIKKRIVQCFDKKSGETGTVGIVICDKEGNVWAATSTGGIGNETPGRVSDSATVAGTYALNMTEKGAAVSCTGKGEDIISLAPATKIVTRVIDGMSLKKSVQKTIQEATDKNYTLGFIAVDNKGNIAIENTKNHTIIYAYKK